MFILLYVEHGSSDVWVFGWRIMVGPIHWLFWPVMFFSHPPPLIPTSGWAALACLVLLPVWSPAAALDWHIPMPGSAWRMGEGSGELW